ncbi:serine-rich adhesin for platelets-like [Dermacentor albipictus]|uniref:serine-rich adhesin for platelets-like n=1 Tax=Dermacentor albipictus TaxID=60249 RepID=UPI0038FD31E4
MAGMAWTLHPALLYEKYGIVLVQLWDSGAMNGLFRPTVRRISQSISNVVNVAIRRRRALAAYTRELEGPPPLPVEDDGDDGTVTEGEATPRAFRGPGNASMEISTSEENELAFQGDIYTQMRRRRRQKERMRKIRQTRAEFLQDKKRSRSAKKSQQRSCLDRQRGSRHRSIMLSINKGKKSLRKQLGGEGTPLTDMEHVAGHSHVKIAISDETSTSSASLSKDSARSRSDSALAPDELPPDNDSLQTLRDIRGRKRNTSAPPEVRNLTDTDTASDSQQRAKPMTQTNYKRPSRSSSRSPKREGRDRVKPELAADKSSGISRALVAEKTLSASTDMTDAKSEASELAPKASQKEKSRPRKTWKLSPETRSGTSIASHLSSAGRSSASATTCMIDGMPTSVAGQQKPTEADQVLTAVWAEAGVSRKGKSQSKSRSRSRKQRARRKLRGASRNLRKQRRSIARPDKKDDLLDRALNMQGRSGDDVNRQMSTVALKGRSDETADTEAAVALSTESALIMTENKEVTDPTQPRPLPKGKPGKGDNLASHRVLKWPKEPSKLPVEGIAAGAHSKLGFGQRRRRAPEGLVAKSSTGDVAMSLQLMTEAGSSGGQTMGPDSRISTGVLSPPEVPVGLPQEQGRREDNYREATSQGSTPSKPFVQPCKEVTSSHRHAAQRREKHRRKRTSKSPTSVERRVPAGGLVQMSNGEITPLAKSLDSADTNVNEALAAEVHVHGRGFGKEYQKQRPTKDARSADKRVMDFAPMDLTKEKGLISKITSMDVNGAADASTVTQEGAADSVRVIAEPLSGGQVANIRRSRDLRDES